MWVNGKIIHTFEENLEKKFNLKLKACSCNSCSSKENSCSLDADKNKASSSS